MVYCTLPNTMINGEKVFPCLAIFNTITIRLNICILPLWCITIIGAQSINLTRFTFLDPGSFIWIHEGPSKSVQVSSCGIIGPVTQCNHDEDTSNQRFSSLIVLSVWTVWRQVPLVKRNILHAFGHHDLGRAVLYGRPPLIFTNGST